MHSVLADKQTPILFIGGVHGDEPEGVFLAQKLLSWLQKNHSSVVTPWALIPCVNPDGHSKDSRINANGVDLNRNFPSADWTDKADSPRYYPGKRARSEAEVDALCTWLETHKPHLIVHFHSWEPCVVYTGAPGKAAAEILASPTPFSVREDIGYPTPGSLGQYGWQILKTPVICIESPERIDADAVWSLFGPGLIQLLKATL